MKQLCAITLLALVLAVSASAMALSVAPAPSPTRQGDNFVPAPPTDYVGEN